MFCELGELEGLLAKYEEGVPAATTVENDTFMIPHDDQFVEEDIDLSFLGTEHLVENQNTMPSVAHLQEQAQFDFFPQLFPDNFPDLNLPHEEFSWAMIELGIEEPLPPQETIDELYIYSHSSHLSKLIDLVTVYTSKK